MPDGQRKVQVVRHDGKGLVEIEERPFVIQSNRADVDLGVIEAAPTYSRESRSK